MRTLLVLTCALILTLGAGSALAAPVDRTATAPQASQTTPKPVNINTATSKELQALPGIGEATATRILEFRKDNGPFKKVEDLMNVRGIGEKTFLTLKPLIVVGPPKGGGWHN